MSQRPDAAQIVALLDAADVARYRLVCTPRLRVEAVLALTPDAFEGAQAAVEWAGLKCEVRLEVSA